MGRSWRWRKMAWIHCCALLYALRVLEAIHRDGFLYKKCGVMLMDLSPNTRRQGTLFDAGPPKEASAKAMAALDALNERYGRDTVHLGSAGVRQRWAMRSDNKTPRYTTHWDELPRARAD